MAQQVLATIARSVSGWQDDGQPASFRRWVSRVARNNVIKFMRRERRQVSGVGGSSLVALLSEVADDTTPDDQHRYDHELVVWAAERIRNEFRSTSWTAFWATLVDGRPVAAVAQELGVTAGSIYMSRSRIMARIRDIVSEI